MPNKTCILALGYLFCAACAPMGSSSGPSLEQRVEQQDIQLRQMQPQQADTLNQLQAMRQEINELKGQLDDLNNAGGAKALADRVRQHDAALRQVDSNMALNLDLGSPMATQTPAYSPQPAPVTGATQTPHAPDSSAYAATAAGTAATRLPAPATGSYGLPPDPAPVPAVAPSDSKWGQADPKPVLQVPKKDISLALFDSGLNAYNARKYDEAQRSFSDFVKNYPEHSQMPEARFYLAECQFQRNRFPEAALAYDTVIKKYPKSSSAPGAYLKQGICFSKMGQPAAAKARMQEVISKFPNSPEAARARNFLKTNK